jgi:branched-chain amino acid transport system ATP-binding protein
MSLLEVRDLVVRYGRVPALHEVSLSVDEGEAVAIVGPNGAGKTTLLSAIAGVVAAAAGTVTYDGRDLRGCAPEAIVRRGIGLVPEGRHIFGTLTVAENLRLGMTVRRDREQARRDLEATLDRFPVLRTLHDTQASRLSGGEQQQLAIGRALLASPRLLLLDEPSLGLAPLVIDLVFEVLEELRDQGVTILLVEQNVARATAFATRSHLMTGGRIEPLPETDDGQDAAGALLAGAYLGTGEAR